MNQVFAFQGSIPPSKSLLIRQLLLTLYQPQLHLPLLSHCRDVVAMQGAVHALRGAQQDTTCDVDCGEAGLVLRLCLGYASRRGGQYLLHGSKRLIERPHEPFLSVLGQLGSVVSKAHSALRLSSVGWRRVDAALSLQGSLSSQFASSLILNAWELPFPLQILCDAEPVSEGYLALSMELARSCGMVMEESQQDDGLLLSIPSGQRCRDVSLSAEADVSSAFAVAALAAVAGSAQIPNFPQRSLQPDVLFVDLLAQMGVPIALGVDGLSVRKATQLVPIEVDLGGAPDLTPVLSVLCALCPGRSRIFGAPQLRGKESDRIATTVELLSTLGRQSVATEDGLEIVGRPVDDADRTRTMQFDASADHRLVMAAAVARWAGFPVEIVGLSAVEKSFPEFLSIAKLGKES